MIWFRGSWNQNVIAFVLCCNFVLTVFKRAFILSWTSQNYGSIETIRTCKNISISFPLHYSETKLIHRGERIRIYAISVDRWDEQFMKQFDWYCKLLQCMLSCICAYCNGRIILSSSCYINNKICNKKICCMSVSEIRNSKAVANDRKYSGGQNTKYCRRWEKQNL